jgi:hypothetical protein
MLEIDNTKDIDMAQPNKIEVMEDNELTHFNKIEICNNFWAKLRNDNKILD